nr:7544_t:CDS:2 [Entrophospora candida]
MLIQKFLRLSQPPDQRIVLKTWYKSGNFQNDKHVNLKVNFTKRALTLQQKEG